jgi:HlyD family secretion protein
MRIRRSLILSLAFSTACGALALGGQRLWAKEAVSAPSVETIQVKRGPLGATLTLKGTLEPLRAEGVAVEPEIYGGPFEIVETAAEGRVVAGQVLVRFDDKEYIKQLAERERGVQVARNRLARSEHDFKLGVREAAVAMDETIRKKQHADEALARYQQFERKTKTEEGALSIQGSRDNIKDQQEELEQLEKMYNEDDLTEETEEIVLNRARRSLERALKYFSFRKSRHDYNMEVLFPREEEQLLLNQRKAANALERLQTTQPLDLEKAEMDLAKARHDFGESVEALEKFRADREALSLKAPFAGFAVVGTFKDGAWGGLGGRETTLAAGEKVKRGQTLYTVVDEAALRVRTEIGEGDVLHIADGGPATVTCALTGKDPFEAVVESVSRYAAGGKHAVMLRVTSKDKRLRAGMACKAELPKANSPEVLSVPAGAILETGDAAYVFVREPDGNIRKAKVELGEKAAGRVELTSGVKAGEVLLKTPPSVDADGASEKDADAKAAADKEKGKK